MDIRKSFGAAVRKYRQSKELSQEALALQIGMDRTYVASVELGKRNISLVNIKKIADGLEITMEQLFASVERD